MSTTSLSTPPLNQLFSSESGKRCECRNRLPLFPAPHSHSAHSASACSMLSPPSYPPLFRPGSRLECCPTALGQCHCGPCYYPNPATNPVSRPLSDRKLHAHGNATFTGRRQHYQGGPRATNMPGHHYPRQPQVFIRLMEVVHERDISTVLSPSLIFYSSFPLVSLV